jgi:hypothetical protein
MIDTNLSTSRKPRGIVTPDQRGYRRSGVLNQYFSEKADLPGVPLWFGLKYAFADIRNRHIERTAASPCGLIQTPKKPTAFRASAKHFKRKKLPMPDSELNETT